MDNHGFRPIQSNPIRPEPYPKGMQGKALVDRSLRKNKRLWKLFTTLWPGKKAPKILFVGNGDDDHSWLELLPDKNYCIVDCEWPAVLMYIL